ncbi:MAG: conjugal transfer protein TraN, partial [Rhizobacter sp.]
MRTLLALLLAACTLPALAQQTMTPQQQQAHDQAKAAARNATSSGGFLDGMAGNKGRAELPASSLQQPPGAQGGPGVAEALVVGCWRLVFQSGVRGQALSDQCEPAIRGVGLSSNNTSEYARLVEELCLQVTDYGYAANTTRLYQHCANVVAAKRMALESLNNREQSVAATQRNVTVTDTTRPGMTQDQIRNSYSACVPQTEQIPAPTEERICETSRASTRDNSCSKTLNTRVTWQCPAGAISGPTRVTAGTLLQAGRYTCEVPVPRNVHSCPAGSTGPTNLVVPPGTQAQPACRSTSDGTVFAATLTVVQDIATRDATYTATDDEWSSGCAALEANTPPALRNLPFGNVGPMAAFDASPNTQRCTLRASTCLDAGAGARLINDVPVTRACWQYSENFDCLTTTTVDQCDVESNCTPSTNTCLEWDEYSSPRTCIRQEVRYSCTIGSPVTRQTTNCETQTFCPGGGACWDTGYKANNDFGEALSLFNASQQAARYYNANDFQIFKGYPAACSHRIGLVLNCCKDNWFGDLLFDALHAADMLRPPTFGGGGGGEDTEQLFNDKTYDMLFASDSTGQLAAGMRAISTMKGEAQEMWGDIKDKDWKKVALRFFVTGPKAIADAAVNATIDQVINMTTMFGLIDGCTEDDKTARQKRKKHLCVDVGSACSTEVPVVGWCWERAYRSCCFNSLL